MISTIRTPTCSTGRNPRRRSRLQTGLPVSYDGSRGKDLRVTTNPDQTPANIVGFANATKTAPYPLLAQIVYLTNAARSNYNALTVSVNKRMSKGLQYRVNYNHAKNLSNGGGYAPGGFASEAGGALSDPSNPNLDYGNVASTRRDRVLYNLPFKMRNRLANQLVNGWEVAGVMLFQSGPFLTVVASGADRSGTNSPNLQGSGRVVISPGTVPQYAALTLNVSNFGTITSLQSAGRGSAPAAINGANYVLIARGDRIRE